MADHKLIVTAVWGDTEDENPRYGTGERVNDAVLGGCAARFGRRLIAGRGAKRCTRKRRQDCASGYRARQLAYLRPHLQRTALQSARPNQRQKREQAGSCLVC